MTDTVQRPCPRCGHTLDGHGGLEHYGTHTTHDKAYCFRYLRDDLDTARAAIAALTVRPQEAAPDWEGFGRAMLEHWPVRDVDGAELFDLSLKYGLIAEVPGGYDPEQHIDSEGISPETGDPWYEYTFREDCQ